MPSPLAPRRGTEPAAGRRRRTQSTAAWVSLGAGVGMLAVEAFALAPARGAVGFATSVLLPTFAPHLLVTSALGFAAARWGRSSRPRVARAASALVAAAAIVPGVVTVGAVATAAHAGGAVNPVTALAVRSMDAAPDATATYGPGPEHGVEIYRPSGPGPFPVLVDVHGGGWSTDARMPATLRRFAEAGWLVVRPEYPLAGPGHPTWDRAPQALARAYAWTAETAPRWGGDPSRISVLGDSAGGGLGIDLAYGVASGRVTSEGRRLPTPRAVVALYPTVDPAAVAGVGLFDAGQAAVDFVGGTPAQVPQRYRALDARTWITPAAPPTLVVAGSRDQFVPPSSVRTFVAAAGAAGVPIRQVTVPLADHAFDAQADRSLGQQVVVSTARAFLAEHDR